MIVKIVLILLSVANGVLRINDKDPMGGIIWFSSAILWLLSLLAMKGVFNI